MLMSWCCHVFGIQTQLKRFKIDIRGDYMSYDEMIKAVKQMYNCCDTRANTIVVNKISAGQALQLKEDIKKFNEGGAKVDQKNSSNKHGYRK